MDNLLVSQTGKIKNISQSTVKNLKNGSQVFVKVLESKGNGKYEGVIAGVRTSFTARNILKPGTSFSANIYVKNGKIIINPRKNTLLENVTDQKFSEISYSTISKDLFSGIDDPEAANILHQLNLPSDNFSYYLVLQFKQMGMKLEGGVINKIRNMAVKFEGKEKRIGRLLILLYQKGFIVSEEELKNLIEQIDNDNLENEENLLKNKKYILNRKENSESDSENNKVIFLKIVKNYFSQIIEGVNQDKTGILTVLNQFSCGKECRNENKWIILPFQIVKNNDEEYKICGYGRFYLLLDFSQKLKVMNINCNYDNKKFSFSLKFDKVKLSKIKLNVESSTDFSGNKKRYDFNFENQLKKKLEEFGCETEVEWCESEVINGTSCEDENLFLFSGDA